MSERTEQDGGAVLADRPTAAALAAVPGNDPVSASEVAAELDVPRSVARDALLELSETGDLEHRQVRGRVGTVDVWYRPQENASASLDDRVSDALEELAVPGASELMQDWRRDAVRESFEYLRDAERADATAVVDAVYPTHEAGYDSEDAWWGMVAPRLARLPGVDDDDGDRWRFVADA
jgi:predicted ArsR family transcriptional regulator